MATKTKRKRSTSAKKELATEKEEKDALRKRLHEVEEDIAEINAIIELNSAISKVSAVESSVEKKEKKYVSPPSQLLGPLPEDLLFEVAKHVHESEALAFAMASRGCRDAMKEVLEARRSRTRTAGKWFTTRTKHYGWPPFLSGLRRCDCVPVSRDWIKWAFSMKWEYAKGNAVNEEKKKHLITYLAARGGFKDVLIWLKSEGVRFNTWACRGAAHVGHIKVLKYLKSEGVPFDSDTCREGAMGGHIKVLKYLKSEGVSFDSDTSFGAARGGHIEVLQYLKSEGAPFGSGTSYAAAFGRHLKVLKYLKSEGVRFDSMTCNAAAHVGHIKVLKYLKSEGVAFDSWTCRGAAEGGHIKVLKYLKSEGVAFDEWTCLRAVYGGRLEVLKWLRSEEVNCPWDIQDCLDVAKRSQREEIVTWIESFL